MSGQFLRYALAALYVMGTAFLLASWAFLYHYPDRSWKQPLVVLLWPLAILAAVLRWGFTRKGWREE
jgi:hypothetical protein